MQRIILVLAALLCACGETTSKVLEAASDVANASQTKKDSAELELLGTRLEAGSSRLRDDVTFAQADLSQLQADCHRIRAIVEGNATLKRATSASVLAQLVESCKVFDNVVLGMLKVDARETTTTGIELQSDWKVRIDAISGAWTAKYKSSDWPLNHGEGYPNYKAGFFTDFRVCSAIAMGSLMGDVKGGCFKAGAWITGLTGLLAVRMNDNARSDNGGELVVRYLILKTPG